MSRESRPPARLRFGIFEVDVRSREVRKQGVRIKLQEQLFHVLKVLLERPGEIVTREELRSQIWSADTFVDFDNSLNTSINKLAKHWEIRLIAPASSKTYLARRLTSLPLLRTTQRLKP